MALFSKYFVKELQQLANTTEHIRGIEYPGPYINNILVDKEKLDIIINKYEKSRKLYK